MNPIFLRQNDETGMMYIRASKYCHKQKLTITYYMIVVSLLITLASIAVKVASRITDLSPIYSQAVVLISGVVLISNIFCSFLEHEFNVLSVNLLERYDIYVFNLPVNKAVLRPIAEQTIINYARKYKNPKKIRQLRNYYFKTPEQAEQKNLTFTTIKKNFEYNQRLLLDVHSLFILLWVGYAVLIMGIAFAISSQEKFIETVINIFVPALSTISLIASAWRSYNENSRKLANCVNVTSELAQDMSQRSSETTLQSQNIIRNMQDALFSQRVSDFTIPEFMIKRFNKKLKKEEELVKKESLGSEIVSIKKRTKSTKPNTTKVVKPKLSGEAKAQNEKITAAISKAETTNTESKPKARTTKTTAAKTSTTVNKTKK